jgi:hypothetical protein
MNQLLNTDDDQEKKDDDIDIRIGGSNELQDQIEISHVSSSNTAFGISSSTTNAIPDVHYQISYEILA